MANVVDALVYAAIANNVTTDADGINSIIQYTSGILPSQTGSTIGPTLNNVLTQTEIKRACCLGKGTIDVRIPLPKEIQLGTVVTSDVLKKKFNYWDKTVAIPKGLCPTGYNRVDNPTDGTTMNNCDVFFKTYCTNNLAGYTKMVESMGGKFSVDEYIAYKPECACFVPAKAYGLDNAGFNVVPKCWYSGCDVGGFTQNKVWLDSVSRGTQNCEVTYCKNILEINNLTAGGSITITPKITNVCGSAVTQAPTLAPTAAPIITTKPPTLAPTLAPTTTTTTAPPTTTTTTAPSTTTTTTAPSTTTTTAPSSVISNIIPSSITAALSESSSTDNTKMYAIIAIIFCVILLMCSSSMMMMMD